MPRDCSWLPTSTWSTRTFTWVALPVTCWMEPATSCSFLSLSVSLAIYSSRLLLAAHLDLVHPHLHLGRAARDLLDGAGHELQFLVTLGVFGNRFLDQGRRVVGGLGDAMRQIAHFARDQGKSHSGFSGPGGFHGRIQ